jgi:hypothetical protein
MKNTRKQLAGARVASKTQLPIRRFAARALAITAVIATSIHGAWAAVTNTVNEATIANFGTVNQINVKPGNGAMSCVPTATMNSFTWLQNAYPAIFGLDGGGNQALQGGQGSWLGAANLLAGPLYMNTSANNGTTLANWINGKVSYLNAYAPGKITFAGMDSIQVNNPPAWLQNANPTVNFLLQELQAGEDVELGIYPLDNVGHALTLTGLTWIDTDSDQTFDVGDTLTLNSIDPAAPNGNTPLILTPGNPMTISGGPYDGYALEVALAESPVPEPASFSLVILGGLVGLRRLLWRKQS